MMSARVLVAPYGYKGTMTASEAAAVMAREIVRARPRWRVRQIPLADGGRGTVETLVRAQGGTWHRARVRDACGASTDARWGELPNGWGAIEVAECAALDSVPVHLQQPHRLSTAGVGELLRHVVESGFQRVIIGLGDSATHDCGIGIASAFGWRFRDERGDELEPLGASLKRLASIDGASVPPHLRSVRLVAFCDVLNDLTGTDGAALRFGPQKGATGALLDELEEASIRFADVVNRELGREVSSIPGAGAAGGIGAGLAGLFDARLVGGADAVLDAVGFDELASHADVVLTGEGRLDRGSVLGKGVGRVAGRLRSIDRAGVVFAGSVDGDPADYERALHLRILQLARADERIAARDEAERRLADGVAAWMASTRERSTTHH